ncbi:MAG: hypothetical protein LBF85_09565, partial [Tannerella sp.]|nr:hypothetical protein [Tannerella sp.]
FQQTGMFAEYPLEGQIIFRVKIACHDFFYIYAAKLHENSEFPIGRCKNYRRPESMLLLPTIGKAMRNLFHRKNMFKPKQKLIQ